VGDPTAVEEPDHALLTLANQPPGGPYQFPAKDVVDAGFLELVRYGIREANDPLVVDSLRVIDAVLKVDTPFGPCWYRYNHDGYGNSADGGPYLGSGVGRLWPLLTGERGHYELAAGHDASPCMRALEAFGGRGALLPEQVWDREDAEAGMRLGHPTGAAMPLLWVHAEYIGLVRSVADGVPFDRIEPVASRYLASRGRVDLEVWKPVRQVRSVRRGDTLRIQAPAAFRLRWTRDEWQTWQDTASRDSGLDIAFVDIPVDRAQQAPVRFTFFWGADADHTTFKRSAGQWEGRDYAVEVR
jgi:glucoamylase